MTTTRALKTLMIAALFLAATKAEASLSYQVSNGNDSGPGSLRQAMLNANAHAGPDTITFAMGVNKTITLTAALPAIFEEVTIDGTSQPGWAGTPLVEIDGENAGSADGFFVQGGPVTIRGLVINRFAVRGIETVANSTTVEGCYIGTDVTGKVALGNGQEGILLASDLNTIGGDTATQRNVISGNGSNGISISSGSQNSVRGNYLGVDATGAAALGNAGYGIRVFSKSNSIGEAGAGNVISGNDRGISLEETDNVLRGNLIGIDASGKTVLGNGQDGIEVLAADTTIGGTGPGAGNVISGNTGSGIDLDAAATGTTVLGNRIGTDPTGAVALGNTGYAIIIRGAGTTIGGAAAGEGNLISGNGRGLVIGVDASDTVVQGNTIGLDLTGTKKLANDDDGIDIFGFDNLIGGTDAGAGNVISGNKVFGISIYGAAAHDNFVQGNKIGTGPDGTTLLGNGYFGIRIVGGFNNTIGGTTPGAGNTIAGNGWSAVRVTWGTGNAILRNSIFENKELGIDLDPRGVSANDVLDVDFGPNGGQNYPVITSATIANNKTKISGRLESKASKAYRVELFSTQACDASGFGEGRTFVAAVNVVTDAAGHADWATTLGSAIPDPHVTATATSTDEGTSEFSPCAAIGGPSPGTLQFAASPFVGWEFEQSVKIAVTRTFGSTGAVTVHYATGGGSATPGVDYTPVSGTLSFADGEVVKTFQIPVVLDLINEGQESIGLTLSSPTGGAILGAWATSQLILVDYKPANPAVTFHDATVVEGAVGGGTMMAFKVDVTPTDHVVEVGYTTADGSAHAGEDYEATSGTLVFQPGDVPKTVLVPIIGDNVAEETESFYLDLTSLTGNAAFNDATGEGVIVDDDKPLPANSTAVCTGGTTIAGAKLVIRGLGGSMGDERMTLDGKLVFATGTPAGFDALDSSGRGAQVLIEDLGTNVPLLALTYQGDPIPVGAFGTSPCDPALTEGWKANATLTTYRYRNRSGELASASCAAGSAAQVRLLTLSDRRATTGKVRVRLVRNKTAIAMPTGPIRATVVLGADASASASGACAVHTFASCTLDALGTKLTCN